MRRTRAVNPTQAGWPDSLTPSFHLSRLIAKLC